MRHGKTTGRLFPTDTMYLHFFQPGHFYAPNFAEARELFRGTDEGLLEYCVQKFPDLLLFLWLAASSRSDVLPPDLYDQFRLG